MFNLYFCLIMFELFFKLQLCACCYFTRIENSPKDLCTLTLDRPFLSSVIPEWMVLTLMVPKIEFLRRFFSFTYV